jgi:hypothetical protein
MRKLVALVFLLATSCYGATPVTCAALKALGYNYLFFGFSGSPTDTFRIAHSNDAVNWTSLGGTWASCGNGSPCAVNSPSVLQYTDSTTGVCHVYLLIAEANDAGINSTKQDIGVLNDDYSVTNLLTFDWASLGSVVTIFAGRWKQVPGSTNCFDSPVTFTTGYYNWSVYTACATLTPTSATISSGPTAVTVTGATNGMYDTVVIQDTTSATLCNLVGTQTNSGLTFRVSAIATGTCPSGPFTWQTNSTTGGSPLAAEAVLSTQTEGPNYLRTGIQSQIFWFENTTVGNLMYTSTCGPSSSIMACVLNTPTQWVEDKTYRAGTMISFVPVPTTGVYGGKLYGGKLY